MPSLVTKSRSKVDLLCVMDFVTTHLIKYSGHTQAILGIFEGSRWAKVMGKLQKRKCSSESSLLGEYVRKSQERIAGRRSRK